MTSPRGGSFWLLISVGAVLRVVAMIGSCGVVAAVVHASWVHGPGPLVEAWYVTLPGLVLALVNGAGLLREVTSLVAALRVHRRLRESVMGAGGRLEALARELGHETRVETLPDSRAFALTYGFLRPRIVISEGMLRRCSDGELAAVLEHEGEHARARDPLRILLGRFAAIRAPLLPAMIHLERRARCDAELAADRRAVRRAGSEMLARAMLAASTPPPSLQGGVVAALGDRHTFEARVQQLEGDTPRLPRPTRRDATISVGGALLMGWFAVSAAILAVGWHPSCS